MYFRGDSLQGTQLQQLQRTLAPRGVTVQLWGILRKLDHHHKDCH
jgi:hypothetical protein